MSKALVVIAIIYGICLFGEALNNCPSPLALIVLAGITFIGIIISDKISDAKEKKNERLNANGRHHKND